jgi:hypothetical protein
VPLEPIVVETVPKAVVIGGGIAGLRAALGLAEIGLGVFLVEQQPRLGGWAGDFGDMYPHGKNGKQLVGGLIDRVRRHPAITVFTGADVVGKAGSFGNYDVAIRVNGGAPGAAAAAMGGAAPGGATLDGAAPSGVAPETITVQVGSIIVATGFDAYAVADDEFGYGLPGVITLPDFKQLLDSSDGPLKYGGRPVGTIVYIYCVGSRQHDEYDNPNTYCSRYCCTAAAHASLQVAGKPGKVHQYHLHRDVRTYGKYELLYTESLGEGSVYLKVPDDEHPAVSRDPETAGLLGSARHGHGAARQRRIGQDTQASHRQGWLLQRDPSQAAPGGNGRRRGLHLRCLPGAQELGRGCCVRPGGCDAERVDLEARVRGARPAGRHRRQGCLRVVRALRRCLSLRRAAAG